MSKERLPTAAELGADDTARIEGEARWIALGAFRATRREGIPAELSPSDAPATEEYSYSFGGLIWVIRCERGWYVYDWCHPVERSAKTLAQAERLLFEIARQRYILIACDGGYLIDTASENFRTYRYQPGRRLTPLSAVRMSEPNGCDMYVYCFRKVARADPAATYDVYRAAPDYGLSDAAAVARDCKYLASFARVYPTCCFCGGPMELEEYRPWVYGYDAHPLSGKQCCRACYDSKVRPAIQAEEAAAEARWRAFEVEAEARAKRDAER